LWAIILIAVLFGAGILALILTMVTRIAHKTEAAWRNENPNEKVILYANGCNCASFPGEKINLRGNGLLVLTPNALHFWMWSPQKRLRIPIYNLLTADVVKSFAGRWGRLPMLHILFRDDTGSSYETAWSVTGAPRWVEEILSIKKTEN